MLRSARRSRTSRISVALAALTILATLALLGACGPTEVVVFASSALPSAALTSVDIAVTSADGIAQHHCACVAPPCATGTSLEASLPLSFALRPGRTSAPSFTVAIAAHAEADCGASPLVTQSARVRFRDGKRLLLRMALDRSCIGVDCGSGDQTCERGVCVSADLPLVETGALEPPTADDLAGLLPPEDLGLPGDGGLRPPRPAPERPLLLASGAASSIGLPVIAGDASGYLIAQLGPGGLTAHHLDIAGALTTMTHGLSASYGNLLVGLPPAITTHGGNVVVAAISDSSGIFAVLPSGSVNAVIGQLPTAPFGGFRQVALAGNADGLHIGLTTASTLKAFVRAQLSGTTYDGPTNDNSAPLTLSNPSVLAAATGPSGAIAYGVDPDPFSHVINFIGNPSGFSSGGAELHVASSLAMAMDATSLLLLEQNQNVPYELRFAQLNLMTPTSFTYVSLIPPILVKSPQILLVRDGSYYVVAYISEDTRTFNEHVCVRGNGTLICSAARSFATTSSNNAEVIDWIAYAAGPSQGGGRYLWRVRDTGSGSVVVWTQRRSAIIP